VGNSLDDRQGVFAGVIGDQWLQYFGYFLADARYIYYQPCYLCVDLHLEMNDKM
jgi:hypothetical protein